MPEEHCNITLAEITHDLNIGFEIYWPPQRLVNSVWLANVPFAFWLIKVLKPRTLVELGTHHGCSFSAFCQAVTRLELPARCVAVDTWLGDEHAGFYDEEAIYAEVNDYCATHYGSFTTLLRRTFDEARPYFKEGEIDLLHIDGLHTYEAVKHDFENWLGAVSSQGIVLFHDTNIRRDNFGVWRFWAELSAQYPHFEFQHDAGLGVLGVGSDLPSPLKYLFQTDEMVAQKIRLIFSTPGMAVKDMFFQKTRYEHELNALLNSRSWRITAPLRRLAALMRSQSETRA